MCNIKSERLLSMSGSQHKFHSSRVTTITHLGHESVYFVLYMYDHMHTDLWKHMCTYMHVYILNK